MGNKNFETKDRSFYLKKQKNPRLEIQNPHFAAMGVDFEGRHQLLGPLHPLGGWGEAALHRVYLPGVDYLQWKQFIIYLPDYK